MIDWVTPCGRPRRVSAVIGVLTVAAAANSWGCACMFGMPGQSYRGELPPLTPQQAALSSQLRADVVHLCEGIGQRNIEHPQQFAQAADWIERQLSACEFDVQRHTYEVAGVACSNLIAERRGRTMPDQIVIIGAHYDSVLGTVGANDNATGVAALLAVARTLKDYEPARTLRLIAFANEEPPFFQTERMGSLVYARRCADRGEQIAAMVSFDGLGFYSDEPHSQHYPFPFNLIYPSTGDFIGFVADNSSCDLVRRCTGTFRDAAQFPSEGGVAPRLVQGIGWSDHWSFWQIDCPAVMVTDTLPFRYPQYHTVSDTPDKIDYDRLARVTEGLIAITRDLTEN